MFWHSPNPLCLISVLSPSAKTTTLLTSVRGIQFSQVVNLPSMEPHSLSPPTLDTLHAVRPSPSYLHCSTHPLYAQANSFTYPVKGHMGYFHIGALTNDLDVNIIVYIYCCKDRHLSSGYWIHFFIAAAKNYHKVLSTEQHILVIIQLWRSQVWRGPHQAEIKMSAGLLLWRLWLGTHYLAHLGCQLSSVSCCWRTEVPIFLLTFSWVIPSF